MANSDELLQRNKDFAATCAHEEASIIARHQVYVITCLDPRTDPSAFLELRLGDAYTAPSPALLTSDRIPPRRRIVKRKPESE